LPLAGTEVVVDEVLLDVVDDDDEVVEISVGFVGLPPQADSMAATSARGSHVRLISTASAQQ
jgi:hypothetical protein